MDLALQSLERQTYKAFEVIAVDDCSTDSTKDILKNWKTQLPINIIQGPGAGIGAALQSGFAQCQGEFIARFDADDICLPNRLQHQVEKLGKNQHLGLIGSSVDCIDKNGSFLFKRNFPFSDNAIKKTLFFKNPFCHGSIMVRKDCLQIVGGWSPCRKVVEDYELWFRFLKHFQCENEETVLLKYRVHPDSDSISKRNQYDRRALTTRFVALQKGQVSLIYASFLPFIFVWAYLPHKMLRYIGARFFTKTRG